MPNFVPPVYFPNTLPFPNFNSFPFPTHNQGGQYPNNHQGNIDHHHHQDNHNAGHFPSSNNLAGQLPFPSNKPTPSGQHPGQKTGPNVFPNQNHDLNNGEQTISQQVPSNGGGQQAHASGGEQSSSHNQVETENGKFPSNAFFKPESVDRQWTEKDEEEWQATTKAPYFENKVPGLECTLPASAVLGEKLKLKFSFCKLIN